jgi:hypothetical protein
MADQNTQALVWSIFFGGGDTTPNPDDWAESGRMLEEIVMERTSE